MSNSHALFKLKILSTFAILRNRTLFTEDWCQFYPPLPHISDVCMCSFLHISTKKNISSPQPASNLTLPWGSLWSFPEEYKWLRQEAQWSWKTQKHSEVKPSGNLMFFFNDKSEELWLLCHFLWWENLSSMRLGSCY